MGKPSRVENHIVTMGIHPYMENFYLSSTLSHQHGIPPLLLLKNKLLETCFGVGFEASLAGILITWRLFLLHIRLCWEEH